LADTNEDDDDDDDDCLVTFEDSPNCKCWCHIDQLLSGMYFYYSLNGWTASLSTLFYPNYPIVF